MRAIHTGVLGVLASCVLLLVAGPAMADAAIDDTRQKPAPSLSFRDEKGAMQHVDPASAKLTIVHFWATWCVPCRAELPEVDATAWAYGDKELKVLAISLDGENKLDKVKNFMAEYKITHLAPSLDVKMAAFRAAGAGGLPATLFIDGQGREVGRAEGALSWTSPEVKAFIDRYVK